jgi:hypothetical protein
LPAPAQEGEIMTQPPSDATQTPQTDPYIALRMRFAENRNNFSGEELDKYGGMLVAWWPDGSRIFDADTEGDGRAFFQRLCDAGYDLSFFVFEVLPVPGESFV